MVYPDYVFSSFFWCAVLPMFLILFAIAGIVIYRKDKEIQQLENDCQSLDQHRKRVSYLEKSKSDLEIELQNAIAQHLEKISYLEKAKDDLEIELQRIETSNFKLSEQLPQKDDLEIQLHNAEVAYERLSNKCKQQTEEIKIYQAQYTDIYKGKWLKSLQNRIIYNNELEVEVKFVHHLLLALGISNDEFSVRQKVTIRLGKNEQVGQADWVIWQSGNPEEKKTALAVIEAKVPSQRINHEVREQARSYAYALNAPIYILTNGVILRVYRRGIESDELLIDCEVGDLNNFWSNIEEILLTQ